MLSGKKALVVGVINKHSFGWHVAKALTEAGAQVMMTYQGERVARTVTGLAESLQGALTASMDVQFDDQIDAVFDRVQAEMGGLDILVHSVAYAPAESLAKPFVETERDAFSATLSISAYSLTALARRARAPMTARGGGSVLTFTYLGGERVIPNYNVMGVAKAALDASVKYLAYDLGRHNIRVNAISAGPVSTAASRGIPGFLKGEHYVTESSPLRRRTDPTELGGTAVFLCCDAARGITGEILHVDSGYHAMGTMAMPN